MSPTIDPRPRDDIPLGEPWSRGNGKDEKLPVEFKTLADFCREYMPLAYAVEPLLRTSALYSLTARTGHGKTAFLIVAALAIATGRNDILGLEVVRGRVAFLTFENPDDVRMRFMIAAYLLNIDIDEIFDSAMILDMRIKPEEVLAKIQKLADVDPFTLVIIDTFAAFFDGNDTNDATQGGEFMRRLRPLTKIGGTAIAMSAAAKGPVASRSASMTRRESSLRAKYCVRRHGLRRFPNSSVHVVPPPEQLSFSFAPKQMAEQLSCKCLN